MTTPPLSRLSDPDLDLEARLRRALAIHPDDTVDVAALLQATQTGSRRRAVRRAVTLAAAAAVIVAVPATATIAASGWRSPGPSASPPVVPGADATTAAPTPTRPPAPSQVRPPLPPSPTWTGTGPDPALSIDNSTHVVGWRQALASTNLRDVAYRIPPAVMLTDVVPPALTQGGDALDEITNPTVVGQACSTPGIREARPIAGTQSSWTDPANRMHPETHQVSLTVTGWAPGTGPSHWAALMANTGTCHWLSTPHPAPTTGLTGDDTWAATTTLGPTGPTIGVAVIRLQDLILAVSVSDPAGAQAAVDQARKLVTIAAHRATTSGLVTTAAHGS